MIERLSSLLAVRSPLGSTVIVACVAKIILENFGCICRESERIE